MDRNELKELAANPDFITGIYNYCDRWCERCALSSRCFLYAAEQTDLEWDDPEVRDLNNAKFWRHLESIFKDAHELIKECAAEAGIDLDAIKSNEAFMPVDEEIEDASKRELAVLARNYAGMVEKWFANEFIAAEVRQLNESNPQTTETIIDLTAAVEIIRWYQFFIAAKVFRALLGGDDELPGVYGNHDDALNPAQSDANGSAKIALIAIDRSLNSWRITQSYIPNKKDSIAPLMTVLERLRNGLEETLPLARDFVRPGFDEIDSEFTS